MTQISEGIKDIFEAAAIGVFAADTGWAIRISKTKDKPDTMIAVYDAPGRAPEPGLDINMPSVQVVVRGVPNGYRDAFAKCVRIKDELLGMPSRVVGVSGDIWASVTMPQDILPLGYDENERPLFALNFDLIVHQGDLTNSHRKDSDVSHPDYYWGGVDW
jgi:Bacteriophage minor capsid protein